MTRSRFADLPPYHNLPDFMLTRILEAGGDVTDYGYAAVLWQTAARLQNNGRFTAETIRVPGWTAARFARLVSWGEVVADGSAFVLPEYLDFNRSRSEIAAFSDAQRDRATGVDRSDQPKDERGRFLPRPRTDDGADHRADGTDDHRASGRDDHRAGYRAGNRAPTPTPSEESESSSLTTGERRPRNGGPGTFQKAGVTIANLQRVGRLPDLRDEEIG